MHQGISSLCLRFGFAAVVGLVAASPEEAGQTRGLAGGVTGEYFRYKHLFHKKPTEQDREEALETAAKIRCQVCVALLSSLVQKAKSFSEDDLADLLEGHSEYATTGDPVTDQMLSHKKGCNKHFKDELIAEGYVLRTCKDVDPSRNDSEPCLFQSEEKPGQMAVDAYELWKEAFFFACEQTVSRHSDALAEHLASSLRKAANHSDVIRNACNTHARCASASHRPRGNVGGVRHSSGPGGGSSGCSSCPCPHSIRANC